VKLIFLFSVLLCSVLPLLAEEHTIGHQPLFRENRGQLVDQHQQSRSDILFYGQTGELSYFLKKDGISYQLFKADHSKPLNPFDRKEFSEHDSVTIQRVDISWLGANTKAIILKKEEASAYDNFYLPQCPDGLTGVRSYGEIVYLDLYPNIDLRYYQQEGKLKYDYIVRPGANPENIRLKVEGAEGITLNENGSLTISTALGDIREGAPEVYQGDNKISSSWKVKNNVLSFELGDYNPNEVLVIDPLVYKWHKQFIYLGSFTNASNSNNYITTDKNGNIYVAGSASQNIGLDTRGFLEKYNPNGTFTGGHIYSPTSPDRVSGTGCAVDTAGNAFLCGSYYGSTANIATSGAHKTVIGQNYDAFLTKFNPAGQILWCTYYGGTGPDYARNCAVDLYGDVILFGGTSSNSGIATPGAHQASFPGGSPGFISKFSTQGTRIWGTYYGGGDKDEILNGTVKGSNIYFCGQSKSTNSIATPGAHLDTKTLSSSVGFLVKLNLNGIRQWGTYFGSNETSGQSCAVDDYGNIYLCGATEDTISIATSGAHQSVKGGLKDGYLAKFDSIGVRLWSSYYGGSKDDYIFGCAVLGGGKLFVCGSSESTNNISTPWSFNEQIPPSSQLKAFLAEFDSAGHRHFGTYFSGNNQSYAYSCAVSQNGAVYLAGSVRPNTGSNLNTLLIKFETCSDPPPVIAPPSSGCIGDSVLLTTSFVPGASYRWYLNNSIIPGASSNVYYAKVSGDYMVWVDSCPTAVSSPVKVVIHPVPAIWISKSQVPCNGAPAASIMVNVFGGTPPYSFAWTGVNATTQTVNNLSTGTYTVTTLDANSCGRSDTIVITQQADPVIQGSATTVSCTGVPHTGSVSVQVNGGNPPYAYSWFNLPDITPTIKNLPAGTYTVQVTDALGCIVRDTFYVVKETTTTPSDPLVSICAITVDSATGKNMVIWEKPASRAFQFNLYRETSVHNQYVKIGTQQAGLWSVFLDQTSVPGQQSYQYRISETDSCGREWDTSEVHRTIHLTSNRGVNLEVNLLWNPYEGRPYNTHYIMRSINYGPFQEIGRVSSGTTSFTDPNPPLGIKKYRIDIDLPGSCNPSAKTTQFNRVSSNMVSVTGPGTVTLMSPNPTTGRVMLLGEIPARIKVWDVLGRVVLDQEGAESFSIQQASRGVYQVGLFDASGNMYQMERLLKQ
jgi:hypothetical protein